MLTFLGVLTKLTCLVTLESLWLDWNPVKTSLVWDKE
jgi:hypothetical protein